MVGLDVVLTACALPAAAGLATAALMARQQRARAIGPRLVSFAVGVLLGVVLLDLLPGLWQATGNVAAGLGLLAAPLIASRLFDRVCACDHAPGHARARKPGAAVRETAVLLSGDAVHSLVDGMLIAAALGVGIVPGAVAALAVSLHEVPRRIAIVALLLQADCRAAKAIGLAAGAGVCTMLGGVLGWWLAEHLQVVLPVALAVSAAALLYVALAQFARLAAPWQARVLAWECGLSFIAGLVAIGGSHHLVDSFG